LAQNDIKRASSINPIYGSSLPIEDKIVYCENVYAAHGLTPLYRMTSFAQPPWLDETLERHGYERFERDLCMSASQREPLPPEREDLRFERPHLDCWLDLVAEMRGLTQERRDAERSRLFESTLPGFAVVARLENEVVGCGLVRVEDDYGGIFDMAMLTSRRGESIGQATCSHLVQIARQHGADRAWLSVLEDNAPAIRLYEKLGFAPVYDYWYRIKRR
jgi:ribosomal protein S18 acetylase RimI-like enzyme